MKKIRSKQSYLKKGLTTTAIVGGTVIASQFTHGTAQASEVTNDVQSKAEVTVQNEQENNVSVNNNETNNVNIVESGIADENVTQDPLVKASNNNAPQPVSAPMNNVEPVNNETTNVEPVNNETTNVEPVNNETKNADVRVDNATPEDNYFEKTDVEDYVPEDTANEIDTEYQDAIKKAEQYGNGSHVEYVPHENIYFDNELYPQGYESTIIDGVDGITGYYRDNPNVDFTEETERDAIEGMVDRGKQPVETEMLSHTNKPYSIDRVVDWEMEPDSADRTTRAGVDGYKNEIMRYYYVGNEKSYDDFDNLVNNVVYDNIKAVYPEAETPTFSNEKYRINLGKDTVEKDPVNALVNYAPSVIPFKTEYVDDDTLDKGVEKVHTEGVIGLKDPVTNEVYRNAVNEVIHVGTRELPVDEPTTDEPTVDEPTVDEPTTDEPTVDEPTTDEPTTDEPTTDEPITDEPTTDEPTTDEPTTDEPTTDEPTVDEPTTDEPTTDEPIVDEPTTDEPTTDEPTTDKPTTDEPTTDEPTTDEPTTDEPTVDEPTTDEPTVDEPTTDEPTTDEPTVDEPTTDEPTTDEPSDKVVDTPTAKEKVAPEVKESETGNVGKSDKVIDKLDKLTDKESHKFRKAHLVATEKEEKEQVKNQDKVDRYLEKMQQHSITAHHVGDTTVPTRIPNKSATSMVFDANEVTAPRTTVVSYDAKVTNENRQNTPVYDVKPVDEQSVEKDKNIEKLPETGGVAPTGLFSGLLALIGGLFIRRSKK